MSWQITHKVLKGHYTFTADLPLGFFVSGQKRDLRFNMGNNSVIIFDLERIHVCAGSQCQTLSWQDVESVEVELVVTRRQG